MSAHFLCPKPTERAPFIPAAPAHELHWLLAPLVPAERKALEAIVECADILTIDGEVHLILPARPELLDALAAYAAEGEDRENDLEDEKDEGEEDDRENDNPADREAMTASGQPYDDEEDDDPREAEADDEQDEGNHLEGDGYRAILMVQRDNKLWKGEPVS